MTVQQLEYIVAVDTWRHFVTASEKCFVTQPTLSMMIRKLEEELDMKIFDRSRQPVVPTDAGERVIGQARIILREVKRINEVVTEMKGKISGEIRIGIIPTLAPYLLPRFLQQFTRAYPEVKLHLSELTTGQIVNRLKSGELDAGILATPLEDNQLSEWPLFYEEFMVYASPGDPVLRRKTVRQQQIDMSGTWLLEEGHCMRNQVLNLCDLRQAGSMAVEYQAGSISTLMRLVDSSGGITIIPELALTDLSASQRKRVRRFHRPYPKREISLVTHHAFIKKRLLQALEDKIKAAVPSYMQSRSGEVVQVDI